MNWLSMGFPSLYLTQGIDYRLFYIGSTMAWGKLLKTFPFAEILDDH